MLEKKYKILFVCLGNICRSPAAEGIMKDLIKRSKLEYLIEIRQGLMEVMREIYPILE